MKRHTLLVHLNPLNLMGAVLRFGVNPGHWKEIESPVYMTNQFMGSTSQQLLRIIWNQPREEFDIDRLPRLPRPIQAELPELAAAAAAAQH